MLAISATDEWRAAHPGATIGLLELSGVENTRPASRVNERKREIEADLRERYKSFTRKDFLALPVMAEYDRYYTRFNKTYHVQLQLESILLKGKRLPDVSPAVDANFMAEVETLVRISCSIIYGQDARSPISSETSRVLYVAYAPAGVAADIVEGQLRGIEENLRLFSAAVVVEQHRLLTT